MRISINFLIALAILILGACTPEIKVPIPEVTVPVPPELSTAVLIAMADKNNDCPPEEHAEPVDNDHDGQTEVDWFDPMSIHGEITVFCPDSCNIRMNLANGFKWRWLVPGTTDRVTEFTFAGELRVPASDQAEFQISVGGPLEAPAEAFVEVSQENLLRIIFIRDWDDKTQASVFHKLHLHPNEVGEWVVFQVLHIQESQTE